MHDLKAVHRCKEAGTVLTLSECTPQPLVGTDFVAQVSLWLKHGYILDRSDLELDTADEAETLNRLRERNRKWFDEQCATLNEELRTKFYWYREESADNAKLRDEAVAAVDKMMKGFHGAALSRLVESGVFWKFPGKGAMLVEAQADQAMQRCKETLDGTRRHAHGRLDGEPPGDKGDAHAIATPAQELFKKLEAEAPKPSGGLSYKLVAEDSSCFSNAGGAGDIHRLHLGNGMTLEARSRPHLPPPHHHPACAEAVSKKCECGRGFEHDKGNDGYCGCGMAGTPNTDCTTAPSPTTTSRTAARATSCSTPPASTSRARRASVRWSRPTPRQGAKTAAARWQRRWSRTTTRPRRGDRSALTSTTSGPRSSSKTTAAADSCLRRRAAGGPTPARVFGLGAGVGVRRRSSLGLGLYHLGLVVPLLWSRGADVCSGAGRGCY
ncbi:hypothetical protein EMIHUDRAFT_439477 [Emiliania huxleyi CCMP1516]|uniref:Uncharacterized protein n=2 Tax=Emiliania huxleyi TaxID=2903 RepID=A0A0D3KYJ8_EMIH1|nr:hypothetical protein EMIHUDRAFT_439477 [Emiliania huxleyi CCMP1516]EOD40833.1 hypothetical protein EMIHUDRAFT_439477 [Emiliania huxleyi CCMP1516]|eukprot:XP_005793262.1 hypothetical protein EMIHUDRAFT_439477 [Emiliania huxleyi CCMP1516]